MGDPSDPHFKIREYYNFAADVDLKADGGGYARNIFVVAAGGGEMRVQLPNDSVAHLTQLVSGLYVEPSPTYFKKILPTLKDAASQVWQLDASVPTYVDETVDFNSAATGDVQPWPATEAAGDQMLVGYPTPFNHLELIVSTSGTVGTLLFKYWNGTAWVAVSGLVDGTTNLTAAPGTYQVTYAYPNDWEAKVENGSVLLYYLAVEVATLYTVNPVLSRGFVVYDTDVGLVRVGW